MIHAFGDRGTILCGKLFPSSQRISSARDIGPSDKVTTALGLVDCPSCREGIETHAAEARWFTAFDVRRADDILADPCQYYGNRERCEAAGCPSVLSCYATTAVQRAIEEDAAELARDPEHDDV